MTLSASSVGNTPDRLGLRHSLIIDQNSYYNHSVLDLGSHNDRWGKAVIDSGARSVTAVDRSPLPSDSPQIKHHTQDIRSFLSTAQDEYDTILCLGVLYHTHDPIGLLQAMMRLKPKQIILDTDVTNRAEPVLEMVQDSYEDTRTDRPTGQGLSVIRCVMSVQAIRECVTALGGVLEELRADHYPTTDDCEDYHRGVRRVFRITPHFGN